MRGSRLPPNGTPAEVFNRYSCPICHAQYKTEGEASQCESLHRIADAAERSNRRSRGGGGSSHEDSSSSDSSSSNIGCIFWAAITIFAFLYYGGGCGSDKKETHDGKSGGGKGRVEKRVNQSQRPLSVGKCVLTCDDEKSFIGCNGTAGRLVGEKVQIVDLHPTLYFRRRNGKDELFVAFDKVVVKSNVEVSHYVDDAKIMRDLWSSSTDGEALFYQGDSLSLAKRIGQGETYQCIIPWNGSKTMLAFDVSGWGELLRKM